MGNTFNISVLPQIATLQAAVTATGVVVTNIHDVDLPAVGAIATATGVIVTNIHDVDLPAAVTAIGTSETNIRGADSDTLKTLSDQLDAMGADRGQTLILDEGSIQAAFTEVLDIPSGKGKILYAYIRPTQIPDQTFVKITIDGVVYEVPFAGMAADTTYSICYNDYAQTALFSYDATELATMRMLNIEFKTSLKVELRRPKTTVGTEGIFTMCYILD